MTFAPFAALQARANRAVLSRLANAVVSYQGGAPFGAIFDSAPADPFSGAVDVASHTCSFDNACLPGIAEGHTLVIDGAAYRVAGGTMPDETGWVTLQVYPQAA